MGDEDRPGGTAVVHQEGERQVLVDRSYAGADDARVYRNGRHCPCIVPTALALSTVLSLPLARTLPLAFTFLPLTFHCPLQVCIPIATFSKYVTEKSTLGVAMGRKILISKENSDLVIDVVRRADRGNSGMGRLKIAEVITELQPGARGARRTRSHSRSTILLKPAGALPLATEL